MWHLYQTIQIPCHYPRLKTCSQSNNMCNTQSLIQRPSKLTNKKQYNHHRTNQQITRMQVWCSMKHTRWSSVQWKPPGCKLTNKYETFKFSCLSMQYPWYNNLWDTLLPRRPWRHGDTHVSIQKYSDSLKSVRLNMHSSGAMAVP